MKEQIKKQKVPGPIEDKTSMTDKQMNKLLVNLYYTKNWEALKRFIDIEMIKAENVLCTIDVIKNPTEALRCQGIRMGLFSIVKYIENEIERRKKDDKEREKGEDNVPNYNHF